MKKIATIIGTRPQIIKANIISKTIAEKYSEVFKEIVIDTFQHYEYNMSNTIYNELNYKADYTLYNTEDETDIGKFCKQMMAIETILNRIKPEIVIVYGDTNSTLVGSLGASKLKIKIAHIEAGMRCGNKDMIEEQNRILTDHLSTYLFVPTLKAIDNLKREGLDNSILVGDVMHDSFLRYSNIDNSVLDRYNLNSKKYILATIHRAENINNKERLGNIFKALEVLSEKDKIVIPLHPHTKKQMVINNIPIIGNIQMIDPVEYISMLNLEMNARCIITDSGGVQREASYCKVPCMVIRNETEWSEIIKYGGCYLVKIEDITGLYNAIMEHMYIVNVNYQNNNACIKILEHLKNET